MPQKAKFTTDQPMNNQGKAGAGRRAAIAGFLLGAALAASAQSAGPKHEFRGVWVATVNNIDWPSRPGLEVKEQKREITALLDQHRELGMNAIILQVRPCSDAFYPSALEPWSRYLTGSPGRFPWPWYDPLALWIEECHQRNMELHAWLNPYRVAQHADEPLAGNHFIFSHPEWAIRYGDKLYFDPGIPGTREYVTSVVCDLVRRYDLDGIHMDDYFYPYPTGEPFPDDRSFARYNRAFRPEEKEAWRRENVDILIKMVHDSISAIKPWVRFGISPFGVWRNRADDPEGSATTAGVTNYDHLYADILKWLRNGWIDYVTPQVYFETGHPAADYETLVKWWNDHACGRQLYIGLAPYKVIREGSSAAWKNPGQLPGQLRIARRYPHVSGCVYFSSARFRGDLLGFQDSLKRHFYRFPALTPPFRRPEVPLPAAPSGLSTPGRKVTWDAPTATPSGEALRYIVYLNEQGMPFDSGNPRFIAGITAGTSFGLVKTGKKKKTYQVRVSAIDRFNNESPPSPPVAVRL